MLVRFNDDHDPAMALRNALRDVGLYKVLPGYEATGAITISCFIVTDEREARVLTAGVGQSLYGLTTAGALHERGYDVVATDIEEDGSLIPFSDRHVDLVVGEYPPDLPGYDEGLRPAERRAVRARLLPNYEAALRAFDPRKPIPGQR
ncbi:MAG: hypothetical protein ACRDY7_00020 [Acidimicrobiia bacterium]